MSIIKKDWKNYFEYICVCWNIKTWLCSDINRWKIKSCWCMMNKMVDDAYRVKHWMSKTRFYHLYHDIIKRCYKPKTLWYKNYWWRWIKCEWNSFEEFRDDMYESYIKSNLKQISIERIDNNKNYSKDNCIWIENADQYKNKRNNIIYWWMPLQSYCKKHWLKYIRIYNRLKRWRNIEDSINKWKMKNQFW
jgi:hypothetical protein